jgi:hypothetical protein
VCLGLVLSNLARLVERGESFDVLSHRLSVLALRRARSAAVLNGRGSGRMMRGCVSTSESVATTLSATLLVMSR